MASFRISCSCGGQWGMEGGKVTPPPELLSPRSQISGPPSTVLPSCSDEVRFSKNSGLHLPLARCTSHHALPSMFVFSYVIIQQGGKVADDEEQFARMKRTFCCVQVDGVELFLPAGLDSRAGDIRLPGARGVERRLNLSAAPTHPSQPRQSTGPTRSSRIQRAVLERRGRWREGDGGAGRL